MITVIVQELIKSQYGQTGIVGVLIIIGFYYFLKRMPKKKAKTYNEKIESYAKMKEDDNTTLRERIDKFEKKATAQIDALTSRVMALERELAEVKADKRTIIAMIKSGSGAKCKDCNLYKAIIPYIGDGE